jgi:hypothetical protein
MSKARLYLTVEKLSECWLLHLAANVRQGFKCLIGVKLETTTKHWKLRMKKFYKVQS